MNVTLTGEAVQFTGQDIPGWEIEHLDVALDGTPVRQARQKFPGGEQIAQQGQWIVTLESGQQVILYALPPVPEPTPEPIGYATPDYSAQPETAPEVSLGNPDAPAAGDQDDVQAEAPAAPTAEAEVHAEEGE